MRPKKEDTTDLRLVSPKWADHIEALEKHLDYLEGNAIEKNPLWRTYKKGAKVYWQGLEYWVVEDNGDYNLLISNSPNASHHEYNDWWVDKFYIAGGI